MWRVVAVMCIENNTTIKSEQSLFKNVSALSTIVGVMSKEGLKGMSPSLGMAMTKKCRKFSFQKLFKLVWISGYGRHKGKGRVPIGYRRAIRVVKGELAPPY